ncbi:MAG: cytochrome C oxidase subunit IV family protein [Planctomycetota bacterium]
MSHDPAPISAVNEWTEPTTDHEHDAEHAHHVVPMSLLVGVLVLLLALTWITVAVTWIDLDAMFNVPNLNVVVALGVALVKAAFVGFYFMHLRWDAPFNGLILVASLAFVVLFISWTILDGQEVDQLLDTPRAARSIQAN